MSALRRLPLAVLALTTALASALPAPEGWAMFRNEAGRDAGTESDSDSESSGPPPPPPEEEEPDSPPRDTAAAERRDTQFLQRQMGQQARDRRQRALRAAVEMRFALESTQSDRDELGAQLLASREFREAYGEAALPATSATIAGNEAAPDEAAEPTTALAAAASAAAAPAGPQLRRGTAALSGTAIRSARQRAALPEAGLGQYDARMAPIDLGRAETPDSFADLAAALGSRRLPALTDKARRRRDVAQALEQANATLPAMTEARLGQVPPDLAAALTELAERGGLAAVRAIAPANGDVNLAAFAAGDMPQLGRRIGALAALTQAAEAAARDVEADSPLGRGLAAVARDAAEDHRRLVAGLRAIAASYPRALADFNLPDPGAAPAGGAGLNAETRQLSFDFRRGRVVPGGAANAILKPEVTALTGDGSLSDTGVDLSGRVPMRLEQRAVATRRVAEALGIGDLVVDSRIVQVRGATAGMGLLMEQAGGNPGLMRRLGPPDTATQQRYDELTALIDEAQGLIDYIDGGQNGTRPATPLAEALDPRMAATDRASYINWRNRQMQTRAALPVTEVQDATGPRLEQAFEERGVSDAALADPDLRRQLSNAQWLDLLCGQVDRHMGNLFIDMTGGTPRLRLIDNDLAFGRDNVAYGLDAPDSTPRFRLPPKPNAIDADLRRALLGLGGDALRSQTRGLLNAAEQEALVERLEMLQDYLRSGQVIAVERPGVVSTSSQGPGWEGDPARLFRGHDRNDTNPQDGEFSYYSILRSYPPRQ